MEGFCRCMQMGWWSSKVKRTEQHITFCRQRASKAFSSGPTFAKSSKSPPSTSKTSCTNTLHGLKAMSAMWKNLVSMPKQRAMSSSEASVNRGTSRIITKLLWRRSRFALSLGWNIFLTASMKLLRQCQIWQPFSEHLHTQMPSAQHFDGVCGGGIFGLASLGRRTRCILDQS